jgi:hypothetical protein
MPAAEVAAWLSDLMPPERADDEGYPWEVSNAGDARTSPA